MPSLRTPETERKYQDYLKTVPKDYCFLCEKDLLIKEYKYSILVKNRFPYDKYFKIHNVLATKRHIVLEEEMTVREWMELQRLKRQVIIGNKYEHIRENTLKNKSVKLHWHIHFLR